MGVTGPSLEESLGFMGFGSYRRLNIEDKDTWSDFWCCKTYSIDFY